MSEECFQISENIESKSYTLGMSDRNINQVLRLYDQVNDGRLTTYEDIIDENVIWHGPSSQEIKGRTTLKNLDDSYLVAYPDAKISILDIITQDNKVVIRWDWKGTHLGTYMGMPPTNRKVNVQGFHIYYFSNEGKIIEIWAMPDRFGEFEQLGMISFHKQSADPKVQ